MSMHIRNEFLQAYRDMFGVSMDTADTLMRQVESFYVNERLRSTDLYRREIESDTFSHQEDAYYAGFGDAMRILKGDMDGFE